MPDTPDLLIESIERDRPRSRLLPLLGLFAIAGLLLFLFFSGSESQAPMNLKQIPKPNTSDLSQISVTTNPAYADKLDLYAEKKAAQAKENGSSFITPISSARSEKRAPEEHRETKTQTIPQRPREKKQSERSQRMRDALAGMQIAFSPQQIVYGTWVPKKEAPAEIVQPKKKLPKPGTILTAVNRVALNSDAPGPALAEIVSGEFRGAKVLGNFQSKNEILSIVFTELITKEGERYPLHAYAVDPRTDKTALASHVDRHYIERFASLFAASFLEGLASAVRTSGEVQYATVYGNGKSLRTFSPEDQALIGLGKVGERAAQSFQQNTNRPATVTLDAGIDIGILIVDCGK
ncbi:MAG: DotG/IcmE/VirB10 family protein [Desulfovibrionaceae bacterium]|nr:DotG/IcmE/VirB10 family protein [Desulfovibrionaceae bacterium]